MRYLKISIMGTALLMASYFSAIGSNETQEKNDITIPSDTELKKQLNDVAYDIYNMILNKNAFGLLKYVDKSVGYGPDHFVSFEKVKENLADTTSYKYCQLFYADCNPELDVSIYDVLFIGKSHNLQIDIEIKRWDDFPEFVSGLARYKWEDMPEEYKREDLTIITFVWTEDGWKIEYFFCMF